MKEVAQVVTIAGIDSSGGAGVNADLKTFHNQGVYSASVITGLTAQNTFGVQDVLPTPAKFIAEQFDSVFGDLNVKAAKTGALFDEPTVKEVVVNLKRQHVQNLVVDPVMVAKGGAKLLTDEAIHSVKTLLFPLAELITPNLTEAAVLVGYELVDEGSIQRALHDLQAMGAKNVLIKGGHGQGKKIRDALLLADGRIRYYESERIETERTHGTGDTLSSYIVAGLAQGKTLEAIMPAAKLFMQRAIADGIAVGHGHGPLNHWVKG
jgi:hydroxymethylpyrimidine/phosphomethylpyrimidine kinase